MLKEYQITNFKPFAGPANIPIKPITLLFGPNSSGKSSIFQPLLILKQTLEEKNRHIPLLSKGSLVDIGSFRDFIHGHQVKRSFSIKMTVRSHTIRYGIFYPFDEEMGENLNLHPNIELLDKSLGRESVSISVSFSWNKKFSTMFISYVDLYFGDNPFPVVTYDNAIGSGDFQFKGNFNHPFWENYWKHFDSQNPKQIETIIKKYFESGEAKITEKFREAARSVLDKFDEGELKEYVDLVSKGKIESDWLNISANDSVNRDDTNTEIKSDLSNLKGIEKSIEAYKIIHEHTSLNLQSFLPVYLNETLKEEFISKNANWKDSRNVSLYFLTTGNLIKNFLDNIIYLAPFRKQPERYYTYSGREAQHVGLSGEMVPDILFHDQKLVQKANKELERFGIDYELKISQLRSEESDTIEVFKLELSNKTSGISSSLRDVGFGFSQVLPIIVQSMLSENKTLLIEQPELHLHPALQAELGDLFINSALSGQKNKFLIETHSEHLILRILRRIRETTDGELPADATPITPEQLAVLYVQPGKEGSDVIHIPVNEDGEFDRPWPQGFFAERAKELF